MATITKVKRKSGTSWKAIIRRDNQSYSKCFQYKRHAQKWAADQEQLVDAGHAGINTTERTMRLSALADLYMQQWTGKDKSKGPQLSRWVSALRDPLLVNLSQEAIEEALESYQTGTKQRWNGPGKIATSDKPRAPASVNRFKAALGALLTFARAKRYMQHNPLENISALKEGPGRTRFLSTDEQARLLSVCNDSPWPKLHLMVSLALMTGARQGELLKLRWCDIDFQECTIQLLDTKNGTDRTIPLVPAMVALLKPWREIGEGLVFPSTRKPRKPFEFRKHWNRAVQDAGLVDFRFHDLRHTFCSRLAADGQQMKLIAELAGHKTITTTARYTHLDMESKHAAVKSMTDAMGGLK